MRATRVWEEQRTMYGIEEKRVQEMGHCLKSAGVVWFNLVDVMGGIVND